jgi:Na+-driven multidrug efflux pump
MKNLRVSATFTAIFGFFSVLALIFLFLALSDIAHKEEDLKLEWHIAGICMIILSAFTVSTFITLGFLIRGDRIWEKKQITP